MINVLESEQFEGLQKCDSRMKEVVVKGAVKKSSFPFELADEDILRGYPGLALKFMAVF